MENEQIIINKLDVIKEELDYIKRRIVDEDTIMDEEDYKALEEARKEFKEGKTTSLEDLKKEIKNVKH